MTDRYQWLATFKCNHFHLTRNDDNASNYMSAADWIVENEKDFQDVDADELQRMKDTNTIWCLHIYSHTPVGFYRFYGATLDYVIDEARRCPDIHQP